MKRIFQDAALQKRFDEQGYIVLPFLNEPEVQALRQHYRKLHPEDPGQGFHSTTFSPDTAYKTELFDGIAAVMNPKVGETFQDVKKLGGSFLVKYPGNPGNMPVHQDWTFVDEGIFRSVTIWIPLEDVNAQNGAITVLPGSHEYTRTLRAPTLPPVFREVDAEIRSKMKTLKMKAGEAFIFDHSLLHASHLNQSDQPRIAVTYGLVHETASLRYYYRDKNAPTGEVEHYEMPNDFFLTYHTVGERPEMGKLTDTIHLEFPQVTTAEFRQMYAQHSLSLNTLQNMKPIFRDPALQEQFDRDGFVKIKLLEQADVDHLLKFYQTLDLTVPEYGFHVSMDNGNRDQVVRVMDELVSVLGAQCDQYFQDYQIFTGSYVVKEVNPKGVVPPHQDWTFVDEDEYWSATLWTPLMDVNIDNGALGVIHGSHRFFEHRRASPSPQCKTPLGEHLFAIFPYLDLIEMEAGEALVFNNKTIHASPPNTTETARIACGIGITHKDAQLFHHYLVPGPEQQVEVYEIEPTFFHHYNNGLLSKMYDKGEKPQGLKVVETRQLGFTPISNPDLMAMIKSNPANVINGPLMEKMAMLFGYNIDGSKKEEPQPVTAVSSNTGGGIFSRIKRFLGGNN